MCHIKKKFFQTIKTTVCMYVFNDKIKTKNQSIKVY